MNDELKEINDKLGIIPKEKNTKRKRGELEEQQVNGERVTPKEKRSKTIVEELFMKVKEGMNDASLSTFVSDLMLKEIAQAVPYPLPDNAAHEFGTKVLDRFRNPYLQHQWLNITLQYTSKMKMRNIPILIRYYELYDTTPKNFAFGFAGPPIWSRKPAARRASRC